MVAVEQSILELGPVVLQVFLGEVFVFVTRRAVVRSTHLLRRLLHHHSLQSADFLIKLALLT